jgi:hypothetical protein
MRNFIYRLSLTTFAATNKIQRPFGWLVIAIVFTAGVFNLAGKYNFFISYRQLVGKLFFVYGVLIFLKKGTELVAGRLQER